MNMTDRDRRALIILGIALAVAGAVYFWPQPSAEIESSKAGDVETAALRLERLRAEAALSGPRQEALKKTRADLSDIEKGLIAGDSLAQSRAQMVQIVRRVARSQTPPVDLRTNDFGAARPFGEQYAELMLTLSLDCQIEQMVNFVADIASQPELLAVEELHVNATSNKSKAVTVRMVVAGVARGSLLKSPRLAGAL